MNRPQCSGTLNAQTTQCTQSALCDATAHASGSRSDGVQRAWETDGCDVVPLRGLQRQCARAVDARIWCKRSNTLVRDWLWALQPMLRRPKYLPHRTRRSAVAKIHQSSDHDVKRGPGMDRADAAVLMTCQEHRPRPPGGCTGVLPAALVGCCGLATIAAGQYAHALHVTLGFAIRRYAAVTVDCALAGVVAGSGQGEVAIEAFQ